MDDRVSLTFVVPGDPVPFARAGAMGKRRFTPAKQANFMNMVRIIAHQAMVGRQLFTGPLKLTIDATYTHPESWSQKKKNATYWKVSRPDLSNIQKIIEDALNDVAWTDDALVVASECSKTYGDKAETTVTIQEV